MVLGFPSNPTAQCVDLSFFERVVALAKEHDILVVHDLAYADITFDGYVAPSIMQVPGARDVAVEFFTMSKSYNMAGWRIGYMVGNRELVGALARIKSYHDYGTFTPIQVASIAALDGPQIASARSWPNTKAVATCSRAVCMKQVGMWRFPRRPCTSGRRSPNPTGRWVLWNSPACPVGCEGGRFPGIGFGEYGDEYVRFALIETSSAPARRCAASRTCSVKTDC